MFNNTDDTLQELYFFIDKIKDRLSHDELNELTDIYNQLTINSEESDDTYWELVEYEKRESLFENHMEKVSNAVTSLFDDFEEENSVETLIKEVSKVVNNRVEFPVKPSTYEKYEKEVLHMVKQGYKFIGGLGAKIYNDYLARIEKVGQEKKQSYELRQLKEELQLKNAKVESVGIKVYSVYSNYQGVDATYDAKTGKVSGKGSRNLKDEIIKRVKFFLDYEQDLAF